jgi:hypothetical protein
MTNNIPDIIKPKPRERLPNRRGAEIFDFEHDGILYRATVGRFYNLRPAELFINCGKSGSAAESAAQDASIFVSLMLQYGISLAAITHSIRRNPDGTAASPIGHALDLVARDGGRTMTAIEATAIMRELADLAEHRDPGRWSGGRPCDGCHKTNPSLGPMLQDAAWQRLADRDELLCAKCVFDRAIDRQVVLTFADLLPCGINLDPVGPHSWFSIFLGAEPADVPISQEWRHEMVVLHIGSRA